jgi:uncharacterized membrane protein
MADETEPRRERASDDEPPSPRAVACDEPVWTYRGYRLRASDFTTAMIHFFRAEISRANVWRQRLDTTTNWAVLITVAMVSVSFSEPAGHHAVIMVGTLLVTLFLAIEARRDRYYELWSSRVRLMETDFFAAMLVSPFHPSEGWAESLAESLLQPRFPISMWEAFGRRFRRNYVWLYVILAISWFAKIWFHPGPTSSVSEIVERSAIGTVPGWLVLAVGLAFNSALMAIGLATIGLQKATGEVFPRYSGDSGEADRPATSRGAGIRAWYRPQRRRRQLMALIITDKAEQIAERIMAEMNRGATRWPGTGMYTGEQHAVMLCAITVTEVAQLKALVCAVDPKTFVIVVPAQEILGEGFASLEPAAD